MNEFQRRIGVGEQHYGLARLAGTTKRTPVIADDGPLRGQTVGERTEHDTGRVDARADAAAITVNPNITIRKATP